MSERKSLSHKGLRRYGSEGCLICNILAQIDPAFSGRKSCSHKELRRPRTAILKPLSHRLTCTGVTTLRRRERRFAPKSLQALDLRTLLRGSPKSFVYLHLRTVLYSIVCDLSNRRKSLCSKDFGAQRTFLKK